MSCGRDCTNDYRYLALSGKGKPIMKRNVPYAIIVPIAVVCFAVVLMLWSMAGTNGDGGTRSGETTGRAYTHSNEMPVQAPTAPSNDTGADSARTPNTPLNKSR
jgi:hypothetical protein